MDLKIGDLCIIVSLVIQNFEQEGENDDNDMMMVIIIIIRIIIIIITANSFNLNVLIKRGGISRQNYI
jgi:hypothetical protein